MQKSSLRGENKCATFFRSNRGGMQKRTLVARNFQRIPNLNRKMASPKARKRSRQTKICLRYKRKRTSNTTKTGRNDPVEAHAEINEYGSKQTAVHHCIYQYQQVMLTSYIDVCRSGAVCRAARWGRTVCVTSKTGLDRVGLGPNGPKDA